MERCLRGFFELDNAVKAVWDVFVEFWGGAVKESVGCHEKGNAEEMEYK